VYAFTPCAAPHTRINVLDLIRVCTVQEVGDAQDIAQSLTAPPKLQQESATSLHFRELATQLLTAVLLHLCYTRAKKSLADAWSFLTQEHGSLTECLTTMATTAHTPQGVHWAIASLVKAIQNITGDRELSSVWTTAIRPLALYNDPLVQASTCRSDVNLLDLQYGNRPMALYLIAPSPMALERLHPIYRVILDVAIPRLMEAKVRTWRYRLLNVLDELPWYGYCRAIDKGIAVKAGYGQKDLLVMQDLESLWETYGTTTALWGNTGIRIWHTPSNDLTAKRISEHLLGRGTITTQGESRTGWGKRSVSVHATGRPLLTTDEVLRLPGNEEIVQVNGYQPFRARKCDYRKGRECNDTD
jgi:type IV secretion system protein VirD4